MNTHTHTHTHTHTIQKKEGKEEKRNKKQKKTKTNRNMVTIDCMFVSPPKFMCCNLIPNMITFRIETFGR